MKQTFHIATVLVVLLTFIGIGVLYLDKTSTTAIATEYANKGLTEKTIAIHGNDIIVELAITSQEKSTGLSYRKNLQEGRGMLFVYEKEGIYSFWMKDLHFSLDIIWINAVGNIVHIEHNLSPKTFPKTFSSSEGAQYILEVPGGYAKKYGVSTGDTVLLTSGEGVPL